MPGMVEVPREVVDARMRVLVHTRTCACKGGSAALHGLLKSSGTRARKEILSEKPLNQVTSKHRVNQEKVVGGYRYNTGRTHSRADAQTH